MVPADPNSAAPLPSGGSDPRTRAAPSAAPRIREYELLEQIGQGGMGTVFKASHTMLERMVAIKLLPRERMHHAESVARFRREMKAVGKLVHPNIVQAHDAGEEAGVHFLVMEYVDGVDVSRVQKRCGPLRVADACEIIRQAAVGLQHAHEHRMVHRDIKPSNLLLCRTDAHVRPPSSNITAQDPSQRSDEGVQPTVKLLDLGLALLHEGDASIARNLTDTGQVMGTLDYMAPEQADDTHAVDIRADIYSLGCTLYSLLAGEPPFAGPQFTTAVKKLAAHMQKPFPPLAERCDDIPAELQTILDRMVAKSPADRFVTPGEVAAAIKPLTTGHDLAALLGRATQGKSPTPSGSVHETFAFLSSAFTATQPATPSNQLAPTIDKLAATETLHSTPRRRVPKLGLFAAVGLIVLLVVCAVFMQSGKQAPLDESKVASTLRRAEPSPPSADPQSTLDSNSSSSPEGSSRRSVTATLPDSSTPALDPPLSTLDFPEPPPLEEWLQGREILTVKQDGSAMFTKIQDALNALKPGQVVEVLDKGPYGENLYQRMLDDVGLVSRTQTRVFANGPPSAFDGTPTFHFFNTSRAFRLSGLTFLANANNEGDEATVKVFARGDVLVEDCCFLTPTIADDRFVERALVVVPSESTPQLLVCRRNLILGRLEFNLLGQTHAVYLRQNYIGGASSAPLACSGYPGTIQLRENVVHTAFDSRIRAPSAISLRRSTNQPVTVQSPVRFVANRNTVAAAECAFMVDGWDDESSFVSSGNIYFARKVTNRGSHVIPVTNDTFLQMESADPSRSDISFDRDNPVCFRLQTPDATGATAVGALAPGPAPPEGDWFTRLLDRWKEAQEDLKRMGLEK